MESVISALIGLVGVVVGSLLAPWLSQRNEALRLKTEARRKLIDDARDYVSSKQFGVANFSGKHFYLSLMGALSPDLIREVESFRGSEQEDPTEARERLRKEVLKQLAEIERRWNLI